MPSLAIHAVLTSIALALLTVFPAGTGPVAFVADRPAALGIVAAADGLILSDDGRFIVATSTRPGFAARLYAAGATVVLAAPFAAFCAPRVSKDNTP